MFLGADDMGLIKPMLKTPSEYSSEQLISDDTVEAFKYSLALKKSWLKFEEYRLIVVHYYKINNLTCS